jgi:hypothetical protein
MAVEGPLSRCWQRGTQEIDFLPRWFAQTSLAGLHSARWSACFSDYAILRMAWFPALTEMVHETARHTKREASSVAATAGALGACLAAKSRTGCDSRDQPEWPVQVLDLRTGFR